MPRVQSRLDAHDLARRHEAGESVKALAESVGVSRSAIVVALKKVGVRQRNRSEAMYARMAQATPAQRLAWATPSHEASRGKRHTDEHRVKIAQTRETIAVPTRTERKMIEALESHGLKCIPQKAIGRYNIDVALAEPRIAVEIFGGHWHAAGRHAARYRKRTDHILDAGWTQVVVWVTRDYPIERAAVEYIVALADRLSGDKPARGEEHVIRGDAKPTAVGHAKMNNLPPIECPNPRDDATGQYMSPLKDTVRV